MQSKLTLSLATVPVLYIITVCAFAITHTGLRDVCELTSLNYSWDIWARLYRLTRLCDVDYPILYSVWGTMCSVYICIHVLYVWNCTGALDTSFRLYCFQQTAMRQMPSAFVTKLSTINIMRDVDLSLRMWCPVYIPCENPNAIVVYVYVQVRFENGNGG